MTLVCSLTSWYHHLGLIAYILGNDIKVKNLILIKSTFFDVVMPYESEALSSLSEKVIYLTHLDELHAVLKENTPDYVYLFSSNPYPRRAAKAISSLEIDYKIIEVEEGLGSYRGVIGEIKARFLLTKARHNLLFSMLSSVIQYFVLIAKKFMFKNIPYEGWLNFDRKGTHENTHVSESYKKALDYLKKIKKVSLESEINNNDCLIIGSPFVELKMIDEKDYISRLKEISDKYNRAFVKPHPIESTLKYAALGAEIIDPLIPIERIAPNIGKEAHIYSFSTTSTYTLNLFFGLQTRRIANLDCLFSKLTTEQKNIIRKYSTEY